jgi:ParB-like chromosome segregation protein Spo0J
MRKHESSFTVEMRPIDYPKPYPGNPRKIGDAAVAKVAASIKAFGWRQPVVVDTAGVIVVGHTRHLAARKLGLAQVPVHVADLTPDQAKAYRLADNRTGEETEWDKDALEAELIALGETGFDLELLGFDADELPGFEDEIEDPPATNYAEQYGVIVMCAGEEAQRDTFNKLTEQGYACKVVAT